MLTSIRTTSGPSVRASSTASCRRSRGRRPRSARRRRGSPRAPRRRADGRRRSERGAATASSRGGTGSSSLLASTCGRGRARADPEAARDRRQPPEAGRRSGEGARELGAGARARAGGRARGDGSGRSSRSGSPISTGRPAEDRLDPLGLAADVVRRRSPRGRRRSGTGARRPSSSARASASTSSGSTRTPASGGTNSGGPPIRVATTERPHAIASSSAWPSGSTQARLREDVALGEQARDLVVRDAAEQARRPRGPRAAARSGPSPAKVSVPSPSRANASARRTTFFRSSSAPTQRKRGGPSGARLDGEALAVDAARDDLHLAARLGQLRLELAPQVVGDADHGRRAPHDEAGRGGDARDTRRCCGRPGRAR